MRIAAFMLALVLTSPLAAPSSLAQPSAGPSVEETREALRQRLMTFVTEDYLGNAREGHENFGDLFADRVDYYGKPGTLRARVLADKAAFYRRWPMRRYEIIPGSLLPRPGPDDSVELTFRYTYEVSNGARSARGIGETTLGLILGEDGRYRIVKETGGVVRRTGGR